MTASHFGGARRRWTRSLRLVFEHDDGRIRLASSQRVEMIPPPSDPLDGWQGGPGCCCVLYDEGGEALWRRVLHDPLQLSHETFSPRGPSTLRRRPVSRGQGQFTLIVPYIEEAHELALFATARGARGEITGPAAEVGRVPLRD